MLQWHMREQCWPSGRKQLTAGTFGKHGTVANLVARPMLHGHKANRASATGGASAFGVMQGLPLGSCGAQFKAKPQPK